uniref:Decapping nuclease n=1 Tax=Parastrongyloides trichosuri TaxID=131310 RepID=A0A0N5A4X3_PARTI
MDSLNISLNLEEKNHKFPYISRPECICEFSVDQSRKMTYGRMPIKYFYESSLKEEHPNYNLNEGMENRIEKTEFEGLRVVFDWIIKQTPDKYYDLKKICHDTDFVCLRGLLTKIGSSIYGMKDSFNAIAQYHNGVIFISEYETEDDIEKKLNRTYEDKKFCYWGRKFEKYVTCDHADSIPDTTQVVSEFDEHIGIFKLFLEGTGDNLDKVKLLYGAEVDCVDPKTGKLMEIKTQYDRLNESFWRHKAVKWWLQSFFVGIDKIIVGYRDNQGIVKKVGLLPLNDLTNFNGERYFSGKLAMNYILKTLAVMKQSFVERKDSVIFIEKKVDCRGVELIRMNDPSKVGVQIFTKEFLQKFPKKND